VPVRVVFLGSDAWSVPSLVSLFADPEVDVVLVVTRAPHPARRGGAPVRTPVADMASGTGLALTETPTVRRGEGFEQLRAAAAEMLAVVAYGELLTPEVLGLAPVGAVNLHFSLLPRWRGAAPVQRAILAGDRSTGVTTILMDEGLDTGPVLQQREEPILEVDDAGSLGGRLADRGAALLVESLLRFARGELAPAPQVGAATLAPKVTAEDRVLRWDEPATASVRRVRAFAPAPGATTRFRDAPFKILRAETLPAAGSPGEVVDVDADGFVIATVDGGFRPLEVAPAGRARMSGHAFARGARLRPGERFG
jgi:methionyl-tRNA formyltransferase